MKINLQAVRNVFSPFAEINAMRYETLRHETFTENAISEISTESKEYHLVLYKGLDIAASFSLSPLNKDIICLQKIYVREDVWHPGMEHKLLAYAESWAKEIGFKIIQVKCGESGVPFYSKLRYSSSNSASTAQGILYHHMSKQLDPDLK